MARPTVGGFRVNRVALAGKMGSGKTALAKLLKERNRYVLRSLADPLKYLAEQASIALQGIPNTSKAAHARAVRMIGRLFPDPDNAYQALLRYEQTVEKYSEELLGGGKPRGFLQHLATDQFRALDPLVWVEYLVMRTATQYMRYAVDDVRFVNEAERMVEAGWCLVKVTCDEATRLGRLSRLYGHVPADLLTHQSEREFDKIHCEFDRVDGGLPLEETFRSLLLVLERWGGGGWHVR